MKLTLENFRCYQEKKTFEFPSGLTLVSGSSGKGKTSIFKALNFILFGKEQKTTTFGRTSSKVELELSDGTLIVRTRTPNHLTLQLKDGFRAEDKAAQAWIDDNFGVHFLQTSYLTQKCLDNFFTQSRDSRAEILRALSIQSYDIEALKLKNKDQLKDRKAILLKHENEYEFIKSEMKARNITEVEIAVPMFPLSLGTNTDEEVAIREEQRQQTYNRKQLDVQQMMLKETHESLQDSLGRSSNRTAYELQLVELEEQMKNLESSDRVMVVDDSEVIKCRKMVEDLDVLEKIHEKQDTLVRTIATNKTKDDEESSYLEKKIQENVYDKEEFQAIEKEIQYLTSAQQAYDTIKRSWDKLGNSPPLSPTAFKSTVEAASALEFWGIIAPPCSSASLSSEFNQKKGVLAELKKQWDNAHNCPSCQADLAYMNNKIIRHNKDALQTQMTLLNQECTELNKKIQEVISQEQKYKVLCNLHLGLVCLLKEYGEFLEEDVEGLQEDLRKNRDDLRIQQTARDDLRRLEQQRDSLGKKSMEWVNYIQAEISQLKGKLKNSTFSSLTSVSPKLKEETRQALTTSEEKLASDRVVYAQQQDRQRQFKAVKEKSGVIKQYLEKCEKDNIEQLRAKIVEQNAQIKQRTEKAEKFDKRKAAIDKWRVDKETYTEWFRLSTRVKKARTACTIGERAYKCALHFTKIINDTESQILQSFIDQVNQECDKHMEVMFDGSTSLKVVYENSTTNDEKFYVNVQLSRNGEKVPYESLSGGESDRCALALFLAFNKLSKSRVLLLDECLSSLHAQSVEEIVEHIKENFSDRVCIMTLHQTTQGIFDHLVEL